MIVRLIAFGLGLWTLAACELAGDIFKAGFFVGVLVLVAVIATAAWLVRKARGKKGPDSP